MLTAASVAIGFELAFAELAFARGPADASAPAAVPVITLHPGDYAISPDNPAPVVSGTVTELLPGGSGPVPYAGQPVVLADSVRGDISLVTDSAGGFTFTFIKPLPGETITAQVPESATTAAASAPAVSLTGQARLAARLSSAQVNYGTRVSITGTVGFAAGRSVVPLGGQQVRVFADGAGSPAATAVTVADGTFSVVLPREAAGVKWTVMTGGGRYLSAATATLPMGVNLPTAITGFQATLNQYWQLTFHGCLGLTASTPGWVPSLHGLVIQYASGPRGPWRLLGAVPKQNSYVCGDDGRTFTAKLSARGNYAYYRAVFSGTAPAGGTAAAGGTGYLPSVSKSELAWKFADRFARFAVSPHKVRKGGKLTVRGQLQYFDNGKWRPNAKQTVLIILRPQGSRTWYWIAKVTTNAKGAFTATFTDPVTAVWSAEYLGSSTQLAAVAASIAVPLKK
jgi:hypothetical protein